MAPPASALNRPLSAELGKPTATALEKHLGLRTVDDLLRHHPRRWVERGSLTPLTGLVEGELVTVVARVVATKQRPMRQRNGVVLEVIVGDDTSTTRVSMTFFVLPAHRLGWYTRQLHEGARVWFAGKVASYNNGLQLVQPEFEAVNDEADAIGVASRADELDPIYPAAGKLTTWKIAKAVRTILLPLVEAEVPDPLPPDVLAARGLPTLLRTFELLHRPTSRAAIAMATERLRYEEAFVLQTALALRRAALSALPATPYPLRAGGLLDRFDAALPFTLTACQVTIGEQIADDLSHPVPMNRLLQGEVGSGKTLVALRAMLQVVDAGAQAALLAPTEVLAVQHHRSLTAALGDLAASGLLGGAPGATRVTLLTGSLSTGARRTAMLDIASGAAGIVVGTHALIQEAVEFADLGMVVIDEQHRFGVEQRDALRAKSGLPPHVLVMTATPIPRTVAMTVFGDLEVSTLTEMPAGRQPTTTAVVPLARPAYVARCWARVREEVLAGRQAFVVCPRIGGEHASEASIWAEMEADVDPPAAPALLPGAAAVDVLAQLSAEPAMEGLRLGLLHGRLLPEVKDAVMTAFTDGGIDVLVATTVVEVGVDVPNATAMVVMDADRFGLSQLHQLRGRVGRGGHAGICLLVTGAEDPDRLKRLQAVAETDDGFAVADLDLATRREGDVLGAAQSGYRSSLRLLRVSRDGDLIAHARADASALVAADPQLSEHPELAAALRVLDAEREAYLRKA